MIYIYLEYILCNPVHKTEIVNQENTSGSLGTKTTHK